MLILSSPVLAGEVITTASSTGIDRTFVITITADNKDKADLLASFVAEYAYNHYFRDVYNSVDFEELTANQKLQILGLETQRHLLEIAKAQYIQTEVPAAVKIVEDTAGGMFEDTTTTTTTTTIP